MEDKTTRLSTANEPQLLLESGPMLIREFNPKGILRFTGRKCITCGQEILDHWLRPADDPDLRGEYWCTKDGKQFSEGISDTVWDVNISKSSGEAAKTSGDK
jgi:hypothetical protein